MPLSNEQAYKRIEQFLLPLNFEELGFLGACIEDAIIEAHDGSNSAILKKLWNIQDKIEELKKMKGGQ